MPSDFPSPEQERQMLADADFVAKCFQFTPGSMALTMCQHVRSLLATVKERDAEIERLRKEVAVDDQLLEERNRLLAMFDCEQHGSGCVPNAIAEVSKLRMKASGTLANNLCPDHRDKQVGKPCLACENERLRAELAKYEDALIADMVEFPPCSHAPASNWICWHCASAGMRTVRAERDELRAQIAGHCDREEIIDG